MCASDGIIFPGFEYKHKNNNPGDYIILPSVKEQQGKITASCLKTLVVFIGGAMDASFQPLLKFVFAPYEKKMAEIPRITVVRLSPSANRMWPTPNMAVGKSRR